MGVDEVVAPSPEAWSTATLKEGSKGPIVCDFAFLRFIESCDNLPGPEVWLVIRRNLADPSVSSSTSAMPRSKLP